jgi:hypothetical protein
MKKIFIVLTMFFIIVINGCEKLELTNPQSKKVQDFLNSKEFKNNECTIASYGKIGIGKVESLNQLNKSAEQLLIPILKNDVLVAYLQVIELPKDNLPDGEIYFMNLVDFKNFDNNVLTGTVTMLGLNYGRVKHSEFVVKNNKISIFNSFPAPKEYQDRFSKGFLKDFLACYRQQREWQDSIDIIYFTCELAKQSCVLAASAWCIWELATN